MLDRKMRTRWCRSIAAWRESEYVDEGGEIGVGRCIPVFALEPNMFNSQRQLLGYSHPSRCRTLQRNPNYSRSTM